MSRKKRSAKKKKRESRYKYLGKRVKDVGQKGLDNPREVREIAAAIVSDYRNKRISYRTAVARLNLLDLLLKKDSKLRANCTSKCIDELRDYIAEKRAIVEGLRVRRTK